MANEEHLAKLEEGRYAWNEWRAENPNVVPDFSGSYFNRRDFSLFDLSGANFEKVAVSRSHFYRTVLVNTNFSHAALSAVSFHRAIVDGADFTGALLIRVALAGMDLSRCRGLEAASFHTSVSIGIDTFFQSGGLPEPFMVASGIPEAFITYASSLVGKAIEYYSCFLSYSSKDEDFARRLYDGLQGKNIRTWFAPEDLKIGSRFRTEIDESIRLHDKLVLVLSEHSINSAWVRREVEAALEREDGDRSEVLFPIRVDDSIFASNEPWAAEIKRSRHIGDFRNWKSHDDYAKSFDRLVRDLKREGPIVMKG